MTAPDLDNLNTFPMITDQGLKTALLMDIYPSHLQGMCFIDGPDGTPSLRQSPLSPPSANTYRSHQTPHFQYVLPLQGNHIYMYR